MSINKQSEKMISISKKLLKDDVVQTVIGYTCSDTNDLGIPFFINDETEADNLIWSNRCVPNLASYLLNRTDKTGIIAKPCDVRAIINLIVEKQIIRENVYIIGMDCPGMTDEEGNTLAACNECLVNIPPLCDEHIENPDVKSKSEKKATVEKGLGESLERFVSEMEKCILCFSCRQACYGCYCQTCFMDRGMPDWRPENPDISTKMLYHMGRTMHLAGRCVECGSCENACASGVNVRYLISEVTHFVEELYGFEAGLSLDEIPALIRYDVEDKEVGFIGGGEHE